MKICIGSCSAPTVISFTNKVKNSTSEEFNVFGFVLIIPIMHSKLTIIFNGISVAYIGVKTCLSPNASCTLGCNNVHGGCGYS